jgi:small-conductance mechanosensitive channel
LLVNPSNLLEGLGGASTLATWSAEGWQPLAYGFGRAGLVLALTFFLAGRTRRWFERATSRTRADRNTRLGVGRLLALFVLVMGSLTALDAIGIPLSTVVTFVGVVGLAISLALQDILKNFFAGLYLVFERPFRLGDTISVKDQRGVVENIGIRTTTLRTDENVQILIPNMTMFAEIVQNRTEVRPKPAETAESVASKADGSTPRPT